MTSQDHPYPRVESLINTFSDWLKHRRELSEIRQMDRTDFDRIASDLRVSPGELDTLVRQGPHAADELPQLLATLGISEASLAPTDRLGRGAMSRSARGARPTGHGARDSATARPAGRSKEACLTAPTMLLLNTRPSP